MADQYKPTFFILPRQTKMPGTLWRRRLLTAASLALTVGPVLSGACGGTTNTNADPCENVYANQCGGACTSDADCPAAVHCGFAGTCTADYGDGAKQCPDGQSPGPRARCLAGGATSNFDAGTGGPGQVALDDGGACAATKNRGEGLPADIYIMNDQSGSMTCSIPTGGDRWDAMKAAITQFLQSPEASGLGVGIQYFAQGNHGSMTECDPATYTPADVEIAPLPGNAQPIVNSLNAHKPGNYTSTPPALKGAINHATQWATAHPDHYVAVVLATDGEPNVGICGDKNTTPDKLIPVVDQIAAAGFSGANGAPRIPTYVIGIVGGAGTCPDKDPAPPNRADLDSVATAGGTQSAFIVDTANGNTTTQFLSALNAIRGAAVIPCQYKIPASTSGQTIDYNAVNVGYTPSGGSATQLYNVADASQCPAEGAWYYDNNAAPTKILICGAACDTVKSDAMTEVSIYLGCKTQTNHPH